MRGLLIQVSVECRYCLLFHTQIVFPQKPQFLLRKLFPLLALMVDLPKNEIIFDDLLYELILPDIAIQLMRCEQVRILDVHDEEPAIRLPPLHSLWECTCECVGRSSENFVEMRSRNRTTSAATCSTTSLLGCG